jgi:tetratricopeptide (TPR) repeat protein
MGGRAIFPPFFMHTNNKLLKKAEKAMALGNFSVAISHLNDLIAVNPNEMKYLILRGEAHLRIENYEAGLIDYAKVVEVENKNITALVNFAAALIRCNKQSDAKDVLEYVLELDPDSFDAHINLCNVYQTLGKSEECLKLSLKAIGIRPGSYVAYNNLGTALSDLNLIDEAREAFITANLIEPNYVSTIINLAQLEIKTSNHIRGIELFESALTLNNITDNESELVRYYLGYAYLYIGDLARGWDYYEYGFGSLLPAGSRRSNRKFVEPRWSGEPLDNQVLLVWREQGLGDEIEFATCLHDVAQAGLNVVLECEPRLVNIFKRTFPTFKVRAESVRADFFPITQDFDIQCPIGSLPRIYRRSIDSFDKELTPLVLLASSVNEFRRRLSGHVGRRLIGICWRSGLFSVIRNLNYTALSDWKELLSQPDFQFVNLQYGDCENEIVQIEDALGIQILRWPDLNLKNDLENVLGLIKNLDAVVTVGTAVSSLAASCDVPTYWLAHQSWVMLGQKKRYPWYKCVFPLVAGENEHLAENIKRIPDLIRKSGEEKFSEFDFEK